MTDNKDEPGDKIHFVYEDPQFSSRSSAAYALRRLGNAFVRHRFSDDELTSLANWATSTAQKLERSEPRSRPSDYFERRYSDPRPVDGSEVIAFSDRTFSGPANPMGVEVEIKLPVDIEDELLQSTIHLEDDADDEPPTHLRERPPKPPPSLTDQYFKK